MSDSGGIGTARTEAVLADVRIAEEAAQLDREQGHHEPDRDLVQPQLDARERDGVR